MQIIRHWGVSVLLLLNSVTTVFKLGVFKTWKCDFHLSIYSTPIVGIKLSLINVRQGFPNFSTSEPLKHFVLTSYLYNLQSRTECQTFRKKLTFFIMSRTGVPNLGYTYPQGYICLSIGVHLRLAIEDKNVFTCCLFSNVYTYIS